MATKKWYIIAAKRWYIYVRKLTEDIVIDTEVSYPYVGVGITGLPDNGWEFWWRVKAGNPAGESGWSSAWKFTNGPSALPEPPGLLQPADDSNAVGTLIEFRWEIGHRASSHRLQVAVDRKFEQIVFDQEVGYYIGVKLVGFPDHGIQYWWRMMSSNPLGSSDWGQAWSFINGPGQRGEITGWVGDETNPLDRAIVSINAKSAMTGADGRYIIRNVPSGPHTLSVARQGFHNTSREITLAEGESLELNITLTSNGTHPDIEVTPDSLTFSGT